MLDELEGDSNLANQDETLQRFYDSVRKRAEGIDNADGKQRIIIELYDRFFKAAFPKMADQLGIVYTPIEVVDFIIHSVNDVLKKEFSRTLSDENIHILDPFTGTGTFMTRLLQSGLIDKKDLKRKYENELHANEIVLLAYYIAAVNIENVFHDLTGNSSEYEPFEGIVLTDTFQLGETDENQKMFSEMFPQNSARVARQKNAPLRVIMGNPPYSVGQNNANDNAQNQKYGKLDGRIAETYAKATTATNKNSLYDSYIKAFRWSTDRLDPNHGGIVAFVSNGAWLDGNSSDGFRKVLEKEFSSIWVFNLRGNARTQGELRKKEAGNVFGSGSRTPISITLLVKNPTAKMEKACIHYYDIGDYLSREEKLTIIKRFGNVANTSMEWRTIFPNVEADWISQRSGLFETLLPLEPNKKYNLNTEAFFVINSRGNETGRDAWNYNTGLVNLKRNADRAVEFYNRQRVDFQKEKEKNTKIETLEFIDTDQKKISWTSSLISSLEKNEIIKFNHQKIVDSLYRPFYKQHCYLGDKMTHRRGQFDEIFNESSKDNLVICVSGVGVTKEFSAIITNILPDLELIGKSQCFPLYYYEDSKAVNRTLFDSSNQLGNVRRDGISNFIYERAKKQYGKNVTKEDIFYYVYGILHSTDYRNTFANDLKKMLPRLPLMEDVKDFWKFSKAGRLLADLHINYENVAPYKEVKVLGEDSGFFTVEKMRFPKKDQKDTIIFNSKITLTNIPAKAYEYVVNGKSAIEWIMERYQVTIDLNSKGEGSGIKNDPNEWAREVGNQRYILDLLLSVINVSVQTVEIVAGLPKLDFTSIDN